MRGFVCIAALCLITATVAQAAPLDSKTIMVSGYADTQVKPDHATVNIGVDTSDKITVKALDANSTLMRRVVDAIKKSGVADSDIQTAHFSIAAIHPPGKNEYEFDLTVTTGYEVSNTLVIDVKDVSQVGAIIDAAVRAGANSSNSVTFEAKNQKALEDQVLADAVRNARHGAEVMAAAEGAKVGKVLSMANSSDYISRFPAMGYATAPLRLAQPIIMPGEVPISAQVTVVFEIE